MTELFNEESYYLCPPLTPAIEAQAELALGYSLPNSYLEVLRSQNGGTLRRQCFPTDFTTSWAPDHLGVEGLLGLGCATGIDSAFGSSYLISEWDYPSIGVVFAATPSGGHDALMFDYSRVIDVREPSVVYIDEDRRPQLVAPNFSSFARGLVCCSRYACED